MSSWVGVGLTSGSSLDGIDLCCVEFTGDYTTDIWGYRILKAATVLYDTDWSTRLRAAPTLSGEQLIRLHAEYGKYLGDLAQDFIQDNDFVVKFVSSNGHNIFHQPDHGFMFQLGDGETLVSKLKVPLVSNFGNKDIALGGQGAPLVPVGETYLFSQYDICLNLGGIACVTVGDIGFDISPCNLLLNTLATRHDKHLAFDKDGDIARCGQIIQEVLDKLDNVEFYSQKPPKTIGMEWFEANVVQIINTENHSAQDLLRTCVEHIAVQISQALTRELTADGAINKSLLVTGGGALNMFLMERIRHHLNQTNLNITVTECDEDTIKFKEALIFAFLGLRCLLGLPNVSSSVTGASTDLVAGSIHLPPVNQPLSQAVSQDYRFHFRPSVTPGFIPSLKHKT